MKVESLTYEAMRVRTVLVPLSSGRLRDAQHDADRRRVRVAAFGSDRRGGWRFRIVSGSASNGPKTHSGGLPSNGQRCPWRRGRSSR